MLSARPRLRDQISGEELRAFDPYDRQMIFQLIRRIEWLNDRIRDHAIQGRPFLHYRTERRALRWALDQLGLTLPENPTTPEGPAMAPSNVRRDAESVRSSDDSRPASLAVPQGDA